MSPSDYVVKIETQDIKITSIYYFSDREAKKRFYQSILIDNNLSHLPCRDRVMIPKWDKELTMAKFNLNFGKGDDIKGNMEFEATPSEMVVLIGAAKDANELMMKVFGEYKNIGKAIHDEYGDVFRARADAEKERIRREEEHREAAHQLEMLRLQHEIAKLKAEQEVAK